MSAMEVDDAAAAPAPAMDVDEPAAAPAAAPLPAYQQNMRDRPKGEDNDNPKAVAARAELERRQRALWSPELTAAVDAGHPPYPEPIPCEPLPEGDYRSDPNYIFAAEPPIIEGPPKKTRRALPDFKNATTTTLTGHGRNVNSLEWNATGALLASGSDDKTARVWAGEDGYKCAHKLEQHGDSVVQLCWDPTTPTSLATLAADKAVRLWDLRESTRCVASVKTNHEYINIAWSLCGQHIAVGSSVGSGSKDADVKDYVSIIDARTHAVVKRLKFAYEVNEFVWAPDARTLLLTTEKGRVEVVRPLGPEADPAEVFKVGPTPQDVDDFPEVEKPEKPRHPANIWTMHAHTDDCYCVALDADSQPPKLAVGSKDSIVSLWDLEEMISVRTILRHTTPVRCLSFSAHGQLVASSAYDPGIDIADAETAELVHTIDAQHAMNSLAWHPTKPVLAYAIDAKSAKDERSSRSRGDDATPYVRLLSCPEKAS